MDGFGTDVDEFGLGSQQRSVFLGKEQREAGRGVCSGPRAFPEILMPHSWLICGALNSSKKTKPKIQKGAVKFVPGEAAKIRAGVWKCWILVTKNHSHNAHVCVRHVLYIYLNFYFV